MSQPTSLPPCLTDRQTPFEGPLLRGEVPDGRPGPAGVGGDDDEGAEELARLRVGHELAEEGEQDLGWGGVAE